MGYIKAMKKTAIFETLLFCYLL